MPGLNEIYLEALNLQTIGRATYEYLEFGIILEINDGKVSNETIEGGLQKYA